MTPIQEVISKLVKKYPSASNISIARMARKESPKLFSSVHNARTRVQAYRNGKKDEKPFLPPSEYGVGAAFDSLPEGKTEFEDWNTVKLTGKRALILSDVHIPFHDRDALLTAIGYGKKNDPDTIILNGDTADFFSVSFWEKDPRKRGFAAELETMKEFLASLRKTFKKARIIFKVGNHEERFDRYMRVRASELLGIEQFEMKEILGLNQFGIEMVGDKRPMRLGDLNIIHGHEYRFAIANPVNPARGLFLRCKAYAICGHFHQSSYHTEKTVEQNIVATWSTGCLCNLHPEYMPLNNWCHGFAFVEVGNNGKFNMQNKVVRHGKIY